MDPKSRTRPGKGALEVAALAGSTGAILADGAGQVTYVRTPRGRVAHAIVTVPPGASRRIQSCGVDIPDGPLCRMGGNGPLPPAGLLRLCLLCEELLDAWRQEVESRCTCVCECCRAGCCR